MKLTVTMIFPTGPETAARTTIAAAATSLRRARWHGRWALQAFPGASAIEIRDEAEQLVQTMTRPEVSPKRREAQR